MDFIEIKIMVPKYSIEDGMQFKWDKNIKIIIKKLNDQILIQANKEGLISLSRILLSLSQNNVPISEHIHLDDSNSLEEGSSELIIEKIK